MIKTKTLLNPNIHLSEGNIKSKNTEDVVFLTWSLRSKIHCPYATEECKKRCFARKNETFDGVRASRDKNFEETKKETFVRDMINILEYQLSRKKMQDKRIFVRIHTSGDFYNLEYFYKWAEIVKHFKGDGRILFQAYTKSIKYVYEWIKGDLADYEVSDSEAEDALDELNIHIVYSIWHDTNQSDIDLAEALGLQTFTALPKDKIQESVDDGAFLCNGDCGHCKECYTGKSQKIVIPYH
jgi:hypothetical protein